MSFNTFILLIIVKLVSPTIIDLEFFKKEVFFDTTTKKIDQNKQTEFGSITPDFGKCEQFDNNCTFCVINGC